MEKNKKSKQQEEQGKIENFRQHSARSIHARSEAGHLESLHILDLIHELKSHQVSLEFQNDEIRQLQKTMSDLQQEVKQWYDYAPCGYITLDPDGMITNANLMAFRLLNINREVLLHSSFSRFITQKWISTYEKTLKKALETRKRQRIELQLQNDAGKSIRVLLEIEAYFEDAEKTRHFRLVILDMTKQKHAKKELRETEKKYRLIFDNSPVGLNVFAPDGQIVDANNASCKMHGYTKDEILSLEPKDIFSQDSLAKFNEFLETLEKGNYFHAYTKNITKEGVEFSVEMTGVKFSINKEPFFLGITQDISELARAKEELEKSHEKFQSLFRQLPVAVLIVDMDGTIIDYNSETTITGLPREDLLGKNFSSLPLTCKHKLSKILKDVLNGEITPFECEARRPSGEIHIIEIHPDVIAYDRTKRLLFTMLDITRRKESENAIDKKTKQLQALTMHLQSVREEEKAYMSREIHDEFGQVLSALNMNLSNIEQEINNVKDKVKREKILTDLGESKEIIKEAINGVTKMITELRPPELDILGLIPAVKRQINEFEKNCDIRTDFITEIDDIQLDETYSIALFRIVQEALTNVYRHANASRVKITIGTNENELNLSIADNGNGFDQKVIEHNKSFGLLGIEERIMLLKGKINIKSEPGQGTEILIDMPLPD